MVIVRFAVFGDVHGQQNLMFRRAERWISDSGKQLDAILQVGDFETIRRDEDFKHYYAPKKYHHISDIAEHCEGLRAAPVFTVFIGGNHEAWGVLAPNNEGGHVCPNVYYLGRSGTIEVKGVLIGGLTGVYDPQAYRQPLEPQPCYEWKYYREGDVAKLLDYGANGGVDVLLLHEWPKPLDTSFSIELQECVPDYCRAGSPTPAYLLIDRLKPSFAFAGHTHKGHVIARRRGMMFVGLRDISHAHGSMYTVELMR